MKTNFTYITFKQIEEWQNRPLEDKVTAAADIINKDLEEFHGIPKLSCSMNRS